MPFEFGDVVLVPFPFTDQTASKRRPAVVVSGPAYNAARHDIVLMPITSQPQGSAFDLSITDWRSCGLLKPSVVKPVLATLEQRLVIRVIGAMRADDQTGLSEALVLILGGA